MILVVEDDDDVRETLLESLAEEGHAVAGVRDGADALRFLRVATTMPCLILLDLMMPTLNGYQFREAQLERPEWKGIPVVLVTADDKVARAARQLGAAGFLRKPVKPAKLLDTVTRTRKNAARV